jgi:hypothetical protein
MTDKLILRAFDEITNTHKGTIPDSIEGIKLRLDGLGGLLVTSEWYRAATIRAWVEKQQGKRTDLEENSSKLTINQFVKLKIKGLTTKDSVRHYYEAWERTGLPKPTPGDEVVLPDIPFPEWGTILDMGGLKSSESVEWYTPEKYIEAAREVMGGIDLDPASNDMANEIVKAPTFFTKDDDPDGLSQSWFGNVWLNPPYGKGSGLFTTKLIEEYKSGRVKSAILLLNAYGFDSGWFQPLWQYPICFTDHRVQFYSPQKESGGPANANIFIYLGKKTKIFRDKFKEFGHVVILWEE